MHLFLGPQNQAFEQAFAACCGCRYAVGLSSGTDALALALRACDVRPGDEVITVANTFIATVEAIALVGARPVFVDVDPETSTMDCQQLEQVLTPPTRAIIPASVWSSCRNATHPGGCGGGIAEAGSAKRSGQTPGLRIPHGWRLPCSQNPAGLALLDSQERATT